MVSTELSLIRSSGFTLLDLTFSLVLLGALTTIAISHFERAVASRSAFNAAQELMTIFSAHGTAARTLGRDIHLRCEDNARTVSADIDKAFGIPMGRWPSVLTLPAHASISECRFGSTSSSANIVTLRPSGSASPGRLSIDDTGGSRCTITQSLRGARRMECS